MLHLRQLIALNARALHIFSLAMKCNTQINNEKYGGDKIMKIMVLMKCFLAATTWLLKGYMIYLRKNMNSPGHKNGQA